MRGRGLRGEKGLVEVWGEERRGRGIGEGREGEKSGAERSGREMERARKRDEDI